MQKLCKGDAYALTQSYKKACIRWNDSLIAATKVKEDVNGY
ncbi:hypothetical protein [Sphingobacterium micropteri]|nr:hypothetical protein [Sphingobacterium micropteri]